MPIRRTRSTTARSALALGALTVALVLSPVAVSAAQAAPAHHGTVTEAAVKWKHCYGRQTGIPYICGGYGHGRA